MPTTSKGRGLAPIFLLCLLLAAAVSGQQAKGALKLLSDPAGAEITINGKVMGVTPLKIINISSGEYRVALHLQGYLLSDSTVKITPNETQSLTLPLKSAEARPVEIAPAAVFCTLTVKTTPPGAALSINGEPAGVTPYHNDKLAPGTYKLRMETTGYDPMEGSGTLKAGESRVIEKKMVSLSGALSVSTTPSGASLFLNDQASGATPFHNEKLAPGAYGLRLEMAGYTGVSDNITLAKDTAIVRQYPLSHTKAWLDSAETAKSAGYRHGRNVRRVWFGVLAAAAGGTGYYFETQVAAAVDKQKKIQADYRNAITGFDEYQKRFNNAGTTAKDNAKVRNILYGVAGGFGLGFVISLPF